MSSYISRAALRALRASIAPLAAEARANSVTQAKVAAEKKAAAKVQEQFDRLHAPHPLDEAVRRERLVKQQTPARVKKMAESEVFVSGTSIAARKAPKAPAKF